MKFFIVSDRYISYLKKIDAKVPDNYNGKRPFIGIVVTVNGIEYVAPLSSPKPQLERINNSKPSVFKMFSRKDANDFLGVINLNYMIPYLASEVTLLDVDNIQDHK
ncbi:type III toxin-antitoxin system ToxN/AbiQ family toxin, partial [Salmonella enterica]|nr:type III toxin-antitoxin system ToxN/AbiQ family toxin [Salmonella enterica]